MATIKTAGDIETPSGVLTPGGGGGGGTSSGTITLGEVMPGPMKTIMPAGSLNDSGLVTVQPNLTGMVFVPWNAEKSDGTSPFNLQSQNWVQVPGGWGTPTPSACINVTTRRSHWSKPDDPYPSGMEVNFETNSSRVVIQTIAHNGFSSSPKKDMQAFIEWEGKMCKASAMPANIASVSSGAALYRDLTVSDSRANREWWFLVSAQLWFQGVWVEQGSVTRSAGNRPVIADDGDSWREAYDGEWQSSAGYTDPNLSCWQSNDSSFQLIEETGCHVIRHGHGGTGYFNGATTGVQDRNYLSANGHSTFMSVDRVAGFDEKFHSRKTVCYICAGSANDSTRAGSSANMKARVLECLDDMETKDPDIPIVLIGPQGLGDPTPGGGGGLDQNRIGIRDAAAEHALCIGFIDWMDWTDGTGNNGSPADSSWAQLIGPDGLHLNRAGVRTIVGRVVKELSKFEVSLDRVNECLAYVSLAP